MIADALAIMILVLVATLTATSSGAWWSDTWETAGQASQKVEFVLDVTNLLFTDVKLFGRPVLHLSEE